MKCALLSHPLNGRGTSGSQLVSCRSRIWRWAVWLCGWPAGHRKPQDSWEQGSKCTVGGWGHIQEAQLSWGLRLPWALRSELKPDVAEAPGMPTCWRPGTQPEFPGGMERVRERGTEPGCTWKQLTPPLLSPTSSQVLGDSETSKCGGDPGGCSPPSLAVLGGRRGGWFQPPMNLWGCQ